MESTQIAAEQQSALVSLIKSIFDQIDEVWSLKKKGYSAKISSGLLEEMCSVLKDLPKDLEEKYFEYLVVLGSASTSVRELNYTPDVVELLADKKINFVKQLRDVLAA